VAPTIKITAAVKDISMRFIVFFINLFSFFDAFSIITTKLSLTLWLFTSSTSPPVKKLT
jgi:hypothetical protein